MRPTSDLRRSFLSMTLVLIGMGLSILWLRSYWYSDGFSISGPTQSPLDNNVLALRSTFGGITLARYRTIWHHPSTTSSSPQMPARWRCSISSYPYSAKDRSLFWSRARINDLYGLLAFHTYSIEESVHEYTSTYVVRNWSIGVSHWTFVAAMFLYPMVRLRGWRVRRKRMGLSQCLNCGYDLRATPTQCPECGRVVSASAQINVKG